MILIHSNDFTSITIILPAIPKDDSNDAAVAMKEKIDKSKQSFPDMSADSFPAVRN